MTEPQNAPTQPNSAASDAARVDGLSTASPATYQPQRATPLWEAHVQALAGHLCGVEKLNQFVQSRLSTLFPELAPHELPAAHVVPYRGLGRNGFASEGFGIMITPEWFEGAVDTAIIDAVLMHEVAELLLRDINRAGDSIEMSSARSMAQRLGLPSLPELSADLIALRLMADSSRGTNPGAYIRMLRCLPLDTAEPDNTHGRPEQRILLVASLLSHIELDTSANSLTHAMLRESVAIPEDLIEARRAMFNREQYDSVLVAPIYPKQQQLFVENLLSTLRGCSTEQQIDTLVKVAAEPRNGKVREHIEQQLSELLLTESLQRLGCDNPLARFLWCYSRLEAASGNAEYAEQAQVRLQCLKMPLLELRAQLRTAQRDAESHSMVTELIEDCVAPIAAGVLSTRGAALGLALLARQEGFLDTRAFDGNTEFEPARARSMLAPLAPLAPQLAELIIGEVNQDQVALAPLANAAVQSNSIATTSRQGIALLLVERLGERLSHQEISELLFARNAHEGEVSDVFGESDQSPDSVSTQDSKLIDISLESLLNLRDIEKITFACEVIRSIQSDYQGRVEGVLSHCLGYESVRRYRNEIAAIAGDEEWQDDRKGADICNSFVVDLLNFIDAAADRGTPIRVDEFNGVLAQYTAILSDEQRELFRDVESSLYSVFVYAFSKVAKNSPPEVMAAEFRALQQRYPLGLPPSTPTGSWSVPVDFLKLTSDEETPPFGYFRQPNEESFQFYTQQCFDLYVRPFFDESKWNQSVHQQLVRAQLHPDLSGRLQATDGILCDLVTKEPVLDLALEIAFERFRDLNVVPGPATLSALEARAETPLELLALRNRFTSLSKLRAEQVVGPTARSNLPPLVRAFQMTSASNGDALLNLLAFALHGRLSPGFIEGMNETVSTIQIQFSGGIDDESAFMTPEEQDAQFRRLMLEFPERLRASQMRSSKELGSFFAIVSEHGGTLGALAELRELPASSLATTIAGMLLGEDSPLTTRSERAAFVSKLIDVLTQAGSANATQDSASAEFLKRAVPAFSQELHPEEAITLLIPPIIDLLKNTGTSASRLILDEPVASLEDQIANRMDRATDTEEAAKQIFEIVARFLERFEHHGDYPVETERREGMSRAEHYVNELIFYLREFCSPEELKLLSKMLSPGVYERMLEGDTDIESAYTAVNRSGTSLARELVELGLGHRSKVEAEQFRAKLERVGDPTQSDAALTPAKILTSFAAALGIVGTRGQQLAHQYCELSPEMERETARSYDKLVGVSKLAAWETIKSAAPALAQRIARLGRALEGGAFYSVFEGWLISGEHVAIKVLNPNALPRFQRMIEVAKCACAELAETDPRYEIGMLLVNQVEAWGMAEFNAIADAVPLDRRFAKEWNGRSPNPQDSTVMPLLIPNSLSTDSTKVWVEQWVDGKNFTDPSFAGGGTIDGAQLIATLEAFASQLIENALLSEDEQGVLFPADWHPGNFRCTAGNNPKVAVLDRQFMLAVNRQDAQALVSLLSSATAEERANTLVHYLQDLQVAGVYAENRDQLVASLATVATAENEVVPQITNMAIELARNGVQLPLTLSLLLKNAHALSKMRKRMVPGDDVGEVVH